MIRTIALGDYISVQGLYVSRLPDGRISVRVDERVFTGPPVSLAAAPVPAPTANANAAGA